MAEQHNAQDQSQQNPQAQPQIDPKLEAAFQRHPWLRDVYKAAHAPDPDPRGARLDQLYAEWEAYYEKKIAEHGDKPTPRSPNFNNPEWRKKWEPFGFLDPVPWFWNIPDNLPAYKKERRKMMKRLYWKEALATPEELAEYERMVREIDELERELEKDLPGCGEITDYEDGTIIGYLM